MSEQDPNEELASTIEPTEEVVNTEVVEEPVVETETEDTPDLSELEERNKRLFERAKKAEVEVKALKAKLKPELKEPEPAPSDSGLSSKDLYALMAAKVPQEDVDEVVDYAKLKKISVPEALKTNVVKTILSERAEERRTAETANTGSSRRGTATVSVEKLVEAAESSGTIPDKHEDIVKIIKARKGLK